MRRIFGPVNENDKWRYRTNTELRDLYTQPDLVQEIKSRRLRWLGHIARMEDRSMVKTLFMGNSGGNRRQGRPKKRWHDDVQSGFVYVRVRSGDQGFCEGEVGC